MFLILLFMFLAALNFFGGFYYCIFVTAVLFIFLPNRKLQLNYSMVSLLIFSLSLLVFNPLHQDSLFNMIMPFIYPFCYVIGFGLFSNNETVSDNLLEEENGVFRVVYVLAGGTLMHFLLNMVVNWGIMNRNDVIDVWSGDIMAATGQATLASVAVGPIVALLFSKGDKLKKGIAIATLMLILVYNLMLAGRTIFALIIAAVVASLLYVCFTERKTSLKTFLFILIVVLLACWMYNKNVFSIKDLVESSNFYERFYGSEHAEGMEETSRWEHKQAYLERFLNHPWGGGNIRKEYGHSAHDLYLDTYDESGIIALIAIVVYIIASLVRCVKCMRSNILSRQMRLMVLCTYLVCNITFWIEPIMRGAPWLVAVYCFIDGAVTYLLMREKKNYKMLKLFKPSSSN